MKSLVAPILLAMSLSWSIPVAEAFTIQIDTSGSPILAWSSSEITFDLNYKDCVAQGVDTTQLDAAVDGAIAAWNSTPSTNLKLTRGSQVTTTVDQLLTQTSPGNPVIICDASLSTHLKAKPTDAPVNTSNLPAVTQVLRVDSGRHIALALIYINAEAGKAANAKNILALSPALFQIVLAHEMGHALGLGHSADINALMYYDATAKKVLGLAQDDMDGIAYLYPRNELLNSKVFGCGTIAATGGGVGGRRGGKGSQSSGGSQGAAAEFSGLLLFCAGWIWLQRRSLAMSASERS